MGVNRVNWKKPKGKRLTIPAKEFRKHVQYFREKTEALGFELILKKVPISQKPEWAVSYFPQSDSVGEFDENAKTITVWYWGKPNHADIIQTIAHEYRHIEHFKKGLFKIYYKPLRTFIKRNRRNVKLMRKLFNVAHLAENDCDHYGYQYLNDHNIWYNHCPYRYTATYAYELWMHYNV